MVRSEDLRATTHRKYEEAEIKYAEKKKDYDDLVSRLVVTREENDSLKRELSETKDDLADTKLTLSFVVLKMNERLGINIEELKKTHALLNPQLLLGQQGNK